MGACFLFDFPLKDEALNKTGKKNSQQRSVRKSISARVEKVVEKKSSSLKFGPKKIEKGSLVQHVHSALECTFETNPPFVPSYHTPVHITERSLSE